MSATVRPFCSGRVSGRRIVTVSPMDDGRHAVEVRALESLRVVLQVVTEQPPRTAAELLSLLESAG